MASQVDKIFSLKKRLAKQTQKIRLSLGLTQLALAARSGVSYGSLKRFERLGEISLDGLLRLAVALRCEGNLATVFNAPASSPPDLPRVRPPAQFLTMLGRWVRRVFANNEWWFGVNDVVQELAQAKRPRAYILLLRRRDHSLAAVWPQLTRLLPLDTPQGPHQCLCVNTTGLFRLIQSLPTKRAEPWRLWLAQEAARLAGTPQAAAFVRELADKLWPIWS
jgi:transcriptional regulator with XRE-family HTH domain